MQFTTKYATHKRKGKFTRPWISGPDPFHHEMYYAWAKHRSQAIYRKEAYELTWEDWQIIWANPEDFLRRGRDRNDLVLTRQDPELPWTMRNVEIMVRLDHLRRERARTNAKSKS